MTILGPGISYVSLFSNHLTVSIPSPQRTLFDYVIDFFLTAKLLTHDDEMIMKIL